MTNLSNSKLLEFLFESAEAIKRVNGKNILSINHFFAAVLKYCEDMGNTEKSSSDYDATEVKELYELVRDIVATADNDSKIKTLAAGEVSFSDDLVFKRIMDNSRKATERDKKEFVSAAVVVKCIFDSPSAEIKKILDSTPKSERPVQIESHPELSESKEPQKGGFSYDSIAESADKWRKIFSEGKPAEKSEEKKPEEPGFVSPLESEPPMGAAAAKTEKPSNPSQSKVKIAELTEKVKSVQKQLSSVVFGQDNAVSIVASGYFQAELRSITDKKNKKPRATYLFAGPPGVGKTFLAEQLAECLKLPFMRFDMSEYAERDALMELLGTNKSFKGDKEGGLTGFVKRNPRCVLLFDEIEKANIAVIHLFLQVLDAGRLRDTNSGEEVDFADTIIIFTTNAGRKIYEGSFSSNLAGISRKTILKALESDVDPKTGLGSFPAAICSRFATGNVIMFNHMEAHTLRKIAEQEIMRNVKFFEEETGIKCNISDDVYSCILFSEGGHADARTVKSRANSFFSGELYELFRLISNDDNDCDLKNLEEINITLDLPDEEAVLRLFRNDSKGCILSFGECSVCSKFDGVAAENGYKHFTADSFEQAISILNKNDVELIFCDLHTGKTNENSHKLNIEDIESEGRNFFKYICEKTETPLYIISDEKHRYREEEVFSLTREGARGIVDSGKEEEFKNAVVDILTQIHHQQGMISLAKSSKLVTYETAQELSADCKVAEIKVFEITLGTAVDAEDTDSIMSGVSKPDTRFSDIIGADSAKSELKYFVNYLKNPKAYSSKGLGVPKGVLFYGPPGTGKTMLAKAVAGESDVTFICTEGNKFIKKYIGEGEETVHKLFATARKYAPTIIFIDEIDAIAKERKGSEYSTDSILTAFLSEMDGFKTDSSKPIFVLAATNFEVEPGTNKSLDPALLRRFDRHILIDLPDKKSRIEFMNNKLAGKSIFSVSPEEIENLAVRSTGMSLAQLDSVFEFSMRIAVREDKDAVDDAVLEEAFESFICGEEKKWDAAELKKTAYHEAGHAFLCWHSGEVPSYLTIVARGNHGGYMLHGDTEKRGSYTKAMLLDRIRTSLGGRASELVFFGDEDGMTTGASSDLRNATALARSIVCNYGMDEGLGLAVLQENEASDGALAQQVRAAVNGILADELAKAKQILSENSKAIKSIVEVLLQKDHLTSNEIDEIFRANT